MEIQNHSDWQDGTEHLPYGAQYLPFYIGITLRGTCPVQRQNDAVQRRSPVSGQQTINETIPQCLQRRFLDITRRDRVGIQYRYRIRSPFAGLSNHTAYIATNTGMFIYYRLSFRIFTPLKRLKLGGNGENALVSWAMPPIPILILCILY